MSGMTASGTTTVTPIADARRADTTADLHPLLAQRWSPRGFDASYSLADRDLHALLEAARWAPSASNLQPWRFLATRRGERGFGVLLETLAEGNRLWAPRASALIVAVADEGGESGSPWAIYDTGQAMAHLSVQAGALGLSVHQMGGFDASAVTDRFALGPDLRPIAVLAVGRVDRNADLPEALAERERAPRVRRPLAELMLAATPQPTG